jgi:hypothetical protein
VKVSEVKGSEVEWMWMWMWMWMDVDAALPFYLVSRAALTAQSGVGRVREQKWEFKASYRGFCGTGLLFIHSSCHICLCIEALIYEVVL